MKWLSSRLAGFLVMFITLAIYILTANPDVGFTDNGELAAVCTTLGVAHPTGYPLFTLIGHLWSMLPLSVSPVLKLNYFAGFCTAVSAMLFFYLVEFLLQNSKPKISSLKGKHTKKDKHAQTSTSVSLSNNSITIIAAVMALLYGFADTVWAQAVAIEVYSLQLVIFTASIWLFLRAMVSNDRRILLLWGLVLGLGFANHGTTILMAPAMLFLFFKRPNEKVNFGIERWKTIALLALPFLLGLSVWLYLPLRSAASPEFNWGAVHRSWDKFSYHATGKQFQVWMFTGEGIGANFKLFFRLIPYELGMLGIVPLLIGMVVGWKRSKSLMFFLMLLIIGCLFYAVNYSIHDIDTYFLLAFIGLLLITSIGLLAIAEKYPMALPAFVLLPLLAFGMNLKENNHANDYQVAEYTRIMVDNLAPNPVIISSQWDYWCSAFWYKQRVENYRPDIILVEKELLRRTWYPPQAMRWYPVLALCKPEMDDYLKDLEEFEQHNEEFMLSQDNVQRIQRKYIALLNAYISKNFDTHPIYLTLDILQNEPDVAKDYEKIPEGFAFRLYRKNANTSQPSSHPISLDKINCDKFISSTKGRSGHLDDGIRKMAGVSMINLGRYANSIGQTEIGQKALNQARSIDPKNQFSQ
ncbi:MAG: DUF2723 domain-containing protein [Ignavibacteriae bacterium]|nr:DUF2723 domain-containing protein [Ignavibacteriota bacterium]